jgi:hypothetical protein
MKWLWIELSDKGDDLFFGHRQTPQFDTLPDLEILKIAQRSLLFLSSIVLQL